MGTEACPTHAHFRAPLPPNGPSSWSQIAFAMKDEKLARDRLVMLRGEFLNWGTPGAQATVTTKGELRVWIRALEWVLGRA